MAAVPHSQEINAMTALRTIKLSDSSENPFWIDNIELTNRCPFKCIMCPRTHNMEREQGLMDFGLFQSIIDQVVFENRDRAPRRLAEEYVWLHHFGESLVHPDFHEFSIYASNQGLRNGFSLNPLMLTPRIIDKLIEADPAIIYISLDGHDNESFEKIRGIPDAYEKSKEHLMNYLDRKLAAGSKTYVILSMIYFPLNITSIEKTVDYWKSVKGIDQFLSKSYVTWDGSVDEINALNFVQPGTEGKKRIIGCLKPWQKMTVNWDGTVVACCFDHDKKYVLGDASTQALSEIWNGEKMKGLRQQFISKNVTTSPCKSCDKLYCYV
jgi:radical SAM protein with 4Fe4S-binding SPASM domain